MSTTKTPPAAKKAPGKTTAKKKPAPKESAALTDKQRAFVDEYLVDLNATQAAIRAGYNPKTARFIASENLAKPNIADEIAKRQQDRLDRVEVRQDDILRTLLNMLAADANDLVEHRRHCCRYCWGTDHKYQRTANQMERDRAQFEQDELKRQADPEATPGEVHVFDEMGGIGYDERIGPNADCPECFGDGVGKIVVKDTRDLSPSARALYAGVKQTKEGLEVKMQSKESYLQLLMRHAGMLNDKVKLQGDAENPIQMIQRVIVDPKGGA